jgi:hypothetical protein
VVVTGAAISDDSGFDPGFTISNNISLSLRMVCAGIGLMRGLLEIAVRSMYGPPILYFDASRLPAWSTPRPRGFLFGTWQRGAHGSAVVARESNGRPSHQRGGVGHFLARYPAERLRVVERVSPQAATYSAVE